MELITTHTHTCFTNHGEGTVEELVSAAVAAGVSTIAVTEHYPMTATFDPDRYLSMPAERMGEYLAAVEAAREAHPEIEVLVGCEMDWLGDDEDRVITAEDVAPFQLILGSVHLVDRWPFDDPAQRGRWDEVGADLIWRRYAGMVRGRVLRRALPRDVASRPGQEVRLLSDLRRGAALRAGRRGVRRGRTHGGGEHVGILLRLQGDVPRAGAAGRVLPRRRALHGGHRRARARQRRARHRESLSPYVRGGL
ncbi:MAG: PHP domain-containing protein [Eggerthella lenta]